MKSKSKLNYLYSILPEIKYLEAISQVTIKVCTKIKVPKDQILLKHQNAINIHLYKPVYTFNPKSKILTCMVATPLIARHVKKGWDLYSELTQQKFNIAFDFKNPESNQLTFLLYKEMMHQLIKKLEVKPDLIFARIDSLIGFLRMETLIKDFNLPVKVVEKLFCELELHRLKHELVSIHQEHIYRKYLDTRIIKQLFDRLPIKPVKAGGFIFGQNIQYKKYQFTAIQLPWGMDLAEVILDSLSNLNIEHIYLVGGAGCTDDKMQVDDIFIPSQVTCSSDEIITINNCFKLLPEIINFRDYSKRVLLGKLCCVESSLGSKEGNSKIAKAKGISAFDMESWGLVKAAAKFKSKPEISMIYYIMDLPLQGLGLSETYYSKKFLRHLLSRADRGKYYCFQEVIRKMLQKKY